MTEDTAKWMQRRAGILLRLCHALDRRIAKGGKLKPSIRELAARWNGRPLPGGRKLKLSAARLRTIYYSWKRNGSGAFVLHYSGNSSAKVSEAMGKRFFIICCEHRVTSFADAYRTLPKLARSKASYSAFSRSLSPVERRTLRTVFRARAEAFRAERILKGGRK